MSDNLKENVYNDLGLIQLRQKMSEVTQEISEIDTQILQLAQKKSYLQSDLCNINRHINIVQYLLSSNNNE
jgi:hypothetical protein